MNKKNYIGLIVGSLLLSAPAIADVDIGGSLRMNYSYKDYSEVSKDSVGDFDFNVLTMTFKNEWDDLGLNAEYRFYKGFDLIKYGYGYWNVDDKLTVNLGVVPTPFGNKNALSHNWWWSLNYYMGFEGNFGVGASAVYDNGSSLTELGFSKGSVYGGGDYRDYSGTVSSGTITNSDGTKTEYNNEEQNTIAGRHTYTITDGDLTTMIGASVKYGQLYNSKADDTGTSFSYAAHLDVEYDGWGLQAQYLAFDFEQYDNGDANFDPNKIGMGLTGDYFEAASKGNIYTLNLSKLVTTSWGNNTIYNDFSMVAPDQDEFDDSILNTTGVMVIRGPMLAWIDVYTAKNTLFLGGNNLGLTQVNDDWNHRFNINIGYYF